MCVVFSDSSTVTAKSSGADVGVGAGVVGAGVVGAGVVGAGVGDGVGAGGVEQQMWPGQAGSQAPSLLPQAVSQQSSAGEPHSTGSWNSPETFTKTS